jgi:hypothetical protein
MFTILEEEGVIASALASALAQTVIFVQYFLQLISKVLFRLQIMDGLCHISIVVPTKNFTLMAVIFRV